MKRKEDGWEALGIEQCVEISFLESNSEVISSSCGSVVFSSVFLFLSSYMRSLLFLLRLCLSSLDVPCL